MRGIGLGGGEFTCGACMQMCGYGYQVRAGHQLSPTIASYPITVRQGISLNRKPTV